MGINSVQIAEMSLIQGEKPENKPRIPVSRTINHLPLHTAIDYSPYISLEFDLQVQDYCRSRYNQLLLRNDVSLSPAGSPAKLDRATEKRNSYNTNYTPLHRTTRNCKVVVSGDVAVGKTCLVNRFGRDVFSTKHQTTIGVDFDIQKFTILGQPFSLQIWDTAGLERFKCITNSYYRGCQAALLVFDMSNLSTLANVLKWKDEVLCKSKTFDQLENESGRPNRFVGNQTPLLFLIGTKSDLPISEPSRQFIREQANKIASSLRAELWFVSAQTGENVNELFSRIAALCFSRSILDEIQRARFEMSTLGACLREKLNLWPQPSKLIKITMKKDGDNRRSKCINVQCVIK